jgi:CRP/FNR family transcriptional regulator, cyclic AMP receptor protein
VTATTEELLKQVPLFAGLSKSELRDVASLATRLDLAAGSELTHQGEMGGEFIIVLDGFVDVVIDGEVVANCGPRDFFGEIALLEGRRRRVATVVAKTKVAVDIIGRREFSTLLREFPQIEATLRSAMQARLTENEARSSD